MRADLPVEALGNADLLHLLANVSGGHDGVCECGGPGCAEVAAYKRFFGELAETLRSELARRRIAYAESVDPIGFHLFGKLSE